MSRSKTSSSSSHGQLIVLSGPSGAGKGTLVRELLKRRKADLSVSCTTRAPRPNEVDGVSYFFVTPDEFARRERLGDFLESAEVFGNHYGTPRQEVVEKLRQGKDVILEIDVQGAMQVKSRFPDARLVFVEPPSMEELSARLHGRGTETDDQIELRLANAQDELSHAADYDFTVVNDNLEDALGAIENYLDGTPS